MTADDDLEPVLLDTYHTRAEALVIAALLRAEGVDVSGDTRFASDQWTTASEAMETLGTRLYVLPRDLERSRALIAQAHAVGELMGDTDDEIE
jgi:hypothetical protein